MAIANRIESMSKILMIKYGMSVTPIVCCFLTAIGWFLNDPHGAWCALMLGCVFGFLLCREIGEDMLDRRVARLESTRVD